MHPFPFLLQRNQMDCGPTCLYMICRYYGRNFSLEKLRELTQIGKEGVNILELSDAAEKMTSFQKMSSLRKVENSLNEFKDKKGRFLKIAL